MSLPPKFGSFVWHIRLAYSREIYSSVRSKADVSRIDVPSLTEIC